MCHAEQHQATLLLDLPGELRNHIYRLAVVQEACIEPHIPVSDEIRTHETIRKRLVIAPPALVAVSKQTREETLPIYYAETRLRFDESDWERRTFLGKSQHLSILEIDPGKGLKYFRHLDFCFKVYWPSIRAECFG